MDDDDRVCLTYDQSFAMLDVQADSVRRRAAARKWPRRPGNDRTVKVGVPRDAIPPKPPEKSGADDGGARIPGHTPDYAGSSSAALPHADASFVPREGLSVARRSCGSCGVQAGSAPGGRAWTCSPV